MACPHFSPEIAEGSSVPANASFSAGSTVPTKPRRQLRLLLRSKIHAVVDALDGLPVGSLCRIHLVVGKEFRHLVTQRRIAEYVRRVHDLCARKGSTGLFKFSPVLANEIPG